ncbi:MAG TPA: hypothetical protein DEB47_00720, partial [Citreicella sp.]|nr:hypothetical protein [Citreicella sp.]
MVIYAATRGGGAWVAAWSLNSPGTSALLQRFDMTNGPGIAGASAVVSAGLGGAAAMDLAVGSDGVLRLDVTSAPEPGMLTADGAGSGRHLRPERAGGRSGYQDFLSLPALPRSMQTGAEGRVSRACGAV